MKDSNHKSSKKKQSMTREEQSNRYKERNRESRRGKEKDRDRETSVDEKYNGREKRYREDRERAKEKERSKEREREKERDRREKMRKKRRESERDHNGGCVDDVEHRDRKRRKREDDYKESQSSSRWREYSADNSRHKDVEEEQRKLDDEKEKRRKRVREWPENRRNKEELEREHVKNADGDMDLDDNVKETNKNRDIMVNGLDNGDAVSVLRNGGDMEEDEIDPLDAFMNSVVIPEVNKLSDSEASVLDQKSFGLKKYDMNKKNGARSMGRIIPGEESDADDDEDPKKDEDDDKFMKKKKSKIEKLSLVDHSKIPYLEFRKNFYIEVNQIKNMTQEEVAAYRKEHELKVHGKDVPNPIKTWYQTGLTTKILDTIRMLNYDMPMPVQAQAFPVIMSGRDCIAVAKTGSGKTLAFVLPMLRHIMDQPELVSGDGPIALIMAPTRELVQQLHKDIKIFTSVLGLCCVPVYGGSHVPQQIKALKRGAEIVVCTPGRMIDMLCTSGGKITNLRRVSYLVMDEADRMFDMGFGPQITRIIQNTQPNRQTVLFSATFPHKVEVLARKVLNKPVEILVGGRSVVNKDITQLVEIIPENEKFVRLLELLREWNDKGKILIFVQTQDKCDALFRDLINKHRYPCLSLHGGKDQTDRESTISDFKSNVCSLLIATSIAARGLDVKDLELVVNYDAPNHYEDYVHRVGRTGRAGRKGCAVTFLSSEDERYAPDLVKALKLSNQVVPDDLKALADGFMGKVNQGLVIAHGSGYGGSGFKFNAEEEQVRKAEKKAQAKECGFEEDNSDSEDESDAVTKSGGDISQQAVVAQAVASQPPSTGGVTVPLAAAMNLQHVLAKIQARSLRDNYEAELEINDFPQNARWKVTRKETLGPIAEWAGASITIKGRYIQPGRIAGPGEKKLYLFIEGATEQSVKRAKEELKRVLQDIMTQSLSVPNTRPGRYSFD